MRARAATSTQEQALACGVYAITGGLGGLGLRGAELVLERGASSVVLASRSGRVARGGQGLETQLLVFGRAARVLACAAAPRPRVTHLSVHTRVIIQGEQTK